MLGESSQPIRTNEGLQRAQTISDPYDAQRGLNAQRALQAIENVANWLRDVQGRRKALLFFSEGIDYDIYTPFNLARRRRRLSPTYRRRSARRSAAMSTCTGSTRAD